MTPARHSDATSRSARHAADQPVIDLDDTYRRLAHPWTREQLVARYQDAERRGDQLIASGYENESRPLPLVATAIPPSATMSVAIHVLHVLPDVRGDLPRQLLDTTEKNAAEALRRCHRALELDGEACGYSAEEWLPVVYDIAGPVLESASRTREPPTVVEQAQTAISWLSRVLVELDQDSPETPTALTETLACLLTVWVFTDLARERHRADDR